MFRPPHVCLPLFVAIAIIGPDVSAQSRDVHRATAEARAAADRHAAASAIADAEDRVAEAESFDRYVERQASLEMQLGLRFFSEYDDYRAITSFRRYQLLDGGSEARFLASLMIGQIYHRNEKPELAVLSFEQAARSTDDERQRTYAYLLALQQMCLPLSYYAQCRVRLGALSDQPLEAGLRDVVEYQILYTDVVLRSDDVDAARVDGFEDERLREKAAGLVERHAAFEELPLKKPWVSGTLSALLPGAGQLYNGRPVDGLIALGVNGAFGAATYLAFAEAKSVPLGVVAALFTAGFYGGNIVNAVTDAKKINAERYREFFERLKVDYWPRIAFQIDENQVLFSYGFDWPGPTLKSRAREAASESTDRSPDR